MSTFRVNKNVNYTVMSNHHLQDKRLLVMKYVDRMSDYDIAADLDCDRSTVSKRIDRIIERINSQ